MVTTARLDVLLGLKDTATAGINRSFGSISNSAKQAENKTKRAFASMSRAARSFGLVLGGAAVLFAFKKIVDTAIEFESAFAGVRKTVDATEEEFKQLEASLIEMSKTIPVAADELAGIQEIAGQLGVRGVAELTKFTETVAKIAVTTNLTREAAATNFARIANVMQESLGNVDRMGAAIVDLGNNFATTEAEISNFASRIAGAAKVVGLSTADIFGFGAAFSSVGVRAERGGTAVSKSLVLMGTAVEEGGEKLEQFARISGLTSEQFVKAFREDAAQAFALFIEGLGEAGLEGAQILKELELGDQRLVQAFLSVGGASGILTEAIKLSNKAFQENTALNEEAAKRFGTTASEIQIFKNNIAALNIAMGNVFLPIISKILPTLTRFIATLERIAIIYDTVKTGVLNLALALAHLNNLLPGRRGAFDEEIAKLRELRDESATSAIAHIDNINQINIKTQELATSTTNLGQIQVTAAENAKAAADALNASAETSGRIIIKNKETWNALIKARDTFSAGLSKIFVDLGRGVLSAKEAFSQLGLAMVQGLVDFLVQRTINAAFAKVFESAAVASAAVAGPAIASAYAPAAAMASLASFGANAVPAAAGIASVSALAQTLALPKMAEGGIVNRPTMLLAGEKGPEAIIPLGRDAISGVNVTINIAATINGDTDIEALAEQLGFLIERETSRARTIG